MSDPTDKGKDKDAAGTETPAHVHADEHLDDEEKILDGRHDVNYPALLTKDVPGG